MRYFGPGQPKRSRLLDIGGTKVALVLLPADH
jgi:hypothetical protein